MVQLPGRPDTTRVVLWDGRDLDSSVAYDLPLVEDFHDGNVPWSVIAAVLRQLAAAGPDPAAATSVDGLGIPVVDARPATWRFMEEPVYDLTDALHAAVSMIGYYGGDPDPEPELLLGGFLLVGPDAVRLYVDRTAGAAAAAGPAPRIGVDISLRYEGEPYEGVHRDDGGAALPRTRRARLERLGGRGPLLLGGLRLHPLVTQDQRDGQDGRDERDRRIGPVSRVPRDHMARSWPSQYGSRSRRL